MLRDFLTALAAQFRSRMGFRLATFIACLLVAYAPEGLPKLVALFFAMTFGYLMFIYDYAVFTEPILTWWKLKGKVSWEASPTFLTDLSVKMRVNLNKKRPFGVTDAFVGAVADISHNRVIVGRAILNLPEEERNAVVAHELAHLRPRQVTFLMLLIYTVSVGAAAFVHVHPVVMALGVTALFLMVRTFVNHFLEYDADDVGGRFTSKEALASALRHLVKPERYDEPSDTHPSVNSRVSRLLTPQEPLWMRLSFSLMEIIAAKSFSEEFLISFLQDLKHDCNNAPKFLRPIVIAKELLEAAIIWGRHR